MNQRQLNAASQATAELFCSMTRDRRNKDAAILLTPMLFKAINFNLNRFQGDVAFLGFDKTVPLSIPKGFDFLGDVWLAHSIWKGAMGCTVNGDVNYISTDVVPEEDFKIIRGNRTFDLESWESYREHRLSSSIIQNRACRLFESEEQHKRFMEFCGTMPSLSLLDYIKLLPDVTALYNKKDDSYIIDGDLVLHGPYTFDIPKRTTFKGELTLYDTCVQTFPNDAVLEGELSVLSYF